MNEDLNTSELISKILEDNFKNGFRLSSPIDMDKFKSIYYERYGLNLNMTDDEIIKRIKVNNTIYNNKAYSVSNVLSLDIKNKIILYIDKCFDEGAQAIYYHVIFKKFEDQIIESKSKIDNETGLRDYLKITNGKDYNFGDNFLSKYSSNNFDPVSMIRNYLVHFECPVSLSNIIKKFEYIGNDNIRKILNTNSEFIKDGKNEMYFHVSLINLSNYKKTILCNKINKYLTNSVYITNSELLRIIDDSFADLFEKYPLSPLGVLNAVKSQIGNAFFFKGQIISKQDNKVNLADIIDQYSKTHESFTLQQYKNFLLDLGCSSPTSYLWFLYHNAVRVSREDFVSKDSIHFRINDIDEALLCFCTSDYMSVKRVDNFAGFPDVGYTWNIFLLEQYLECFSAKFRLMHTCLGISKPSGAIVKRSSDFKTLLDVVADVLANSSFDLTSVDARNRALNLLHNEGYLSKKQYQDLDSAISKAKEIRYKNMKGNL